MIWQELVFGKATLASKVTRRKALSDDFEAEGRQDSWNGRACSLYSPKRGRVLYLSPSF